LPLFAPLSITREALNQKIKCDYHHNTKSGGNGASRLLPIVKFLQREMMWRTGLADEFFKQCEHDAMHAKNSKRKKNFWLARLHGVSK